MPSRSRTLLRLFAATVTWRLIRYEIADRSMLPRLSPGDWTVGERRPRRLMPGDIVVFPHPGRPDFALVKRVASVEETRVTVLGDAPGVDSTSFGPIPREVIAARLLLRYHPRPALLTR